MWRLPERAIPISSSASSTISAPISRRRAAEGGRYFSRSAFQKTTRASASGTAGAAILASTGKSLEEAQRIFDSGNPHAAGFDVPSATVTVAAAVVREKRTGYNVAGYLRFAAGADKTVTMRIATSLISVDQAKQNLAQEIAPNATFDSVRDAAQRLWDDQLKVIEVEGASGGGRTGRMRQTRAYPNTRVGTSSPTASAVAAGNTLTASK